eukprot:CAMPEP_0174908290 /NCGR_PEP_ID=MMETSP0167-20121228/64201_1 /TAXON_ID=38298 /ORGANISM="Rhodella maculata, Strain CCMP736" /LENGTH=54 /DNA_ID=CAMNT_0016152011 /DNA_START=234 /DNA_END=394 /DNA_ORIENTATION=+
MKFEPSPFGRTSFASTSPAPYLPPSPSRTRPAAASSTASFRSNCPSTAPGAPYT